MAKWPNGQMATFTQQHINFWLSGYKTELGHFHPTAHSGYRIELGHFHLTALLWLKILLGHFHPTLDYSAKSHSATFTQPANIVGKMTDLHIGMSRFPQKSFSLPKFALGHFHPLTSAVSWQVSGTMPQFILCILSTIILW